MIRDPDAARAPARVPLCEGLRIVTAVEGTTGDHESTLTVVGTDAAGIRIETRMTRFVDGRAIRPRVVRRVTRADLESAAAFVQAFVPGQPETLPGSTALGTSAAVLRALSREGRATLAVVDPLADRAAVRRNWRPFARTLELERVGDHPRTLRMAVNGAPAELPVVRARDRLSRETEFTFLDDASNPLVLAYSIAASDTGHPLGAMLTALGNRMTLDVVHLSGACVGSSVGPCVERIDRALRERGRATVHDVLFETASDALRAEARAPLSAIAAALHRRGDASVDIDVHGDGLGGTAFAMALSRQRAAAVARVLSERHGLPVARLNPLGLGASRPVASDDSAVGRSLNRRIEVRLR